MQQRQTVRGPQGREVEFVDVAALEAVDFQPHAAAVGGHCGPLNLRRRLVDFRAAVGGLVDIGVGLQAVRLRIAGRPRVDQVRER